MKSETAWDVAFSYLVMGVRIFFGLWFVVNGLNYWVHFFPQPLGRQPLAQEFLATLEHTRLFDVVKVLEVAIGVPLVINRFVPLAIVAAAPISLVIVFQNFVLEHDPFGEVVGVITLALLAIMALGYLDAYLPMLAYKAGPASLRGLCRVFGAGAAAPKD